MMSRNRKIQRAAKARSRATGEGYAVARERVVGQLPPLDSTLTLAEWQAAGLACFGTSAMEQWSVICPNCGHFITVASFMKAAQITDITGAFTECLGRHLPQGSGETFPCNWAAYGFIPSAGYTVVREDGRTVRVFPFAPVDADLDANRDRFLARVARWRAEQQAEEEAEAAAEAAAEADQEGDDDAEEWCLECARPLGRRHRKDCVWRLSPELGECVEVEEAHTWNDGHALLQGLELLQAPVEQYALEVGRLCQELGVVFRRDIGVRGRTAVRHGGELAVECDLWLEEPAPDGSQRWFGWYPDSGWFLYAPDPVTGVKGSVYLGGPFTPSPEVVAEQIAAVVAGRAVWAAERRWRGFSDPAGWQVVADELSAVLPAAGAVSTSCR
ncbi:VVA0879 family protein [Streptomyces sp. NPDC001404]|uniref:VVA0879 family protein n=1 Tax=Streptomyces sp. NPDC001404 TaxID=3364571 RepID=UPI00369BF1D1